MSKAKNVWLMTLFFLATVSPAGSQQPAKIPQVGIVVSSDRTFELLRQAMRDLGYLDGKNVRFVYRSAEGNTDHMPDLVAELVNLKVDVLVVNNTTLIRAAKQATKTIPIVMMSNQDPVAIGLVDSLARPGGNLTGIASLTRDLSGKRLELFKELAPRISRVGVLWISPTSLGAGSAFQNYQAVAGALKIALQSLEMHRPNPDLEGAFRAAIKARVNALIAVTNAALNPQIKTVVNFSIKNRLPLMVEGSNFVEVGGLLSYATNDADSYRRVAVFVDKILKGRKPADLPVEQPMRFEFVINLKTAKQIGLTIPQWTLMKADKVIQ
jgi:ABC-type uncharacterized transport system substrate-binding protein